MTTAERGRAEAAALAWARMRTFVDHHKHPGNLREELGLGRGTGRVAALLLLKHGPLSLSQIADAHNVDRPYATIIVDKLESLGLVQRTAHPTDRRSKLVALTSAGKDAVAHAEAAFAEPPPALAELSASELAQLNELLSRLA